MTFPALFNSTMFEPARWATAEGEEMPQRTIRLSIIVCGIVLVGFMGFGVLLVGMRNASGAPDNYMLNVSGFITVFAGILIGHIINVGKMFGMEQNIRQDMRHDVRNELQPVVMGVRSIDEKADTAAKHSAAVADKLEQAPIPKTWDELEPIISRIVAQVCDERDKRNVGKDI